MANRLQAGDKKMRARQRTLRAKALKGWESMFAAWGRFVYRRRWPVLAVSGVLLLASIFIVIQGGKLQSGGFIETSESGRASRLIERELPRAGAATFTLIFSSETLTAMSSEFVAAVDAAITPLRRDGRVAAIVTPYDGTALDPTRIISTAIAVSTSPISFSIAETTESPTSFRMRSLRSSTAPDTAIAQASAPTQDPMRSG